MPTKLLPVSIAIATIAMLVAVLGRDWLALAWNAWDYPVAAAHTHTQIATDGNHAYIAAGVGGIEVMDLARGRQQALIPPPARLDRIDDLAIADGWLFALDATPPGHLQVYALRAKGAVAPLGTAIPVAVGPFSGVSAAAGVVAVSGGTSQLTLREYDMQGRLGTQVLSADFGRGQPDITLRADGQRAVVSTHLYGPEFGLTLLEIQRAPLRLRQLGRLRLPDAGFTRGGYKPAHFPLVARWRGDRIYFVDGGGLGVIDAADPQHPRLLHRDLLYQNQHAQPAMDLAIATDALDVATAGVQPEVIRYRLDETGLPISSARWRLPAGARPAAIARAGDLLLISLHGSPGWRSIPSTRFSPAITQQVQYPSTGEQAP